MSAHNAAPARDATLAFEAGLRTLANRNWSPEAVRELLERLLDVTGLDYDQRVELLGGALVAECVRPYWLPGNSPEAAHGLLRRRDDELAEMVESVAPVLLARAEARDEARQALALIESLLDIKP